MKYKLAILAAFLSLISGCATYYNVAPYQASAENAETLKSYKLKPVSVGTFQASKDLIVRRSPGTQKKPGRASIRCPIIDLNGNSWHTTVSPSFEAYIEKALIEELKLAGIYDAASPLVLTGELVQINPGVPHYRKWVITLTLTNARNESFTTVSEFHSEAVAFSQCEVSSQLFVQAVQRLISDVIEDPKFREFAN
jgi:hypothetical protein